MDDLKYTALQRIRMSRGITQEDLAKASGITQTTLSLVETRKVRPSGLTMFKIIKGFRHYKKKVTIEMLFSDIFSGPVKKAQVNKGEGRPGPFPISKI